ncbi:GNAT family N-acetyltransferase [Ulvibacterium marinum]|uniref:GNAT family N-acetyltransferase n=1 Tax=Ulvibacterium marinum TaxID=2419782 RepID=A0A3B0CDZ6_9FLAO|nr:GNAT family N-acetyltransferase [Ulvibacterium marinum]RKN83191.1 GNAT family N-acetyltransferase [Ulvibacterium marinum]
MEENITIRLATIEDLPALQSVGERLFDYPIKPNRTIEFLKDKRHHLVLAYHRDVVVGMASGLHYVHPDKDPELFVNEVSVLDEFQRRGIGRKLVRFLVEYGKELGCKEAWVATEKSNIAAQKAYLAAGGILEDDPFVLIEFKY